MSTRPKSTARTAVLFAMGGIAAALVACSSTATPVPTAAPVPPTATPEPRGIPRDEAIQLAVEITRPLFDQLHSLGQYTTIVRADSMSLGELVALAGDIDRQLDDEDRDRRVWAVEIEIKLIGTPDGPEPAYSLIGIDIEDGGLELIATSQSPVLLATAFP